MHDLLRHVRARGLAWAPGPRGVDAAGREVVAYIEGVVPAYPMPAWVWDMYVLDASARMLRAFHDATAGFSREGRTWQLASHEPDEVICHNDFAPYNLVFRDGLPVGAIDFEAAAPGPRAWDLAYLAYRLVPLAAPSNPDLPAQPARPPASPGSAPPTATSTRPPSSRSSPSACASSPIPPRRPTPSSTSPTPPTSSGG